MNLTKKDISEALPREKEYTLSDSVCLSLRVRPSGTKTWVYNNRDSTGKLRRETLGEWPVMTAEQARAERDRRLAVPAVVPVAPCEAVSSPTFGEVAERWCAYREGRGFAPRHTETVLYRLRKYILPVIGQRPIAELTRVELVALVESMAKVRETASRSGGIIGQIFAWAMDRGLVQSDAVARSLARVLPPHRAEHFATVTDERDMRRVVRAVRSAVSQSAGSCLNVVLYCFMRSGEARRARWGEIDMTEALWTVPPEHMKRRLALKIPYARQVGEILEKLRPVTYCGPDSLVFPSKGKGRACEPGCLSDEALLKYFKGMTPHMTVHGLRSMASTVLNSNGFDAELIELQLAHVDKDRVRAIYNHAERLDERRAMLQWYADWLDKLARN